MLKTSIVATFLLLNLGLAAQDAYHNALNAALQTEFNLPALSQWVLPNTETNTFASALTYGGVSSNLTISGQPFVQAKRIIASQGTDPWDAGHYYPNFSAVSTGDKCVFIIWLRSQTSGAKVNIFVENATSYDKEAIAVVNLTNEWKRYALPFASTGAFAAGALHFGLHLGYIDQTVEVGGAACLNYRNTVQLSALPVSLNNDTYPGIEPDAPWRAAANASIEQVRKANLTVQVRDGNGNPTVNAQVNLEMVQHEFKFGTAVVGSFLNGGNNPNAVYEQKILDLDGAGHGFNEIVFENDLKWPPWEQHWSTSWDEIANDILWLQNHDISIRGHNLVWPRWLYMPDDMELNQNNPTYLRNRIRDHLQSILLSPGIGPEIADWDVLNEITDNNDLAAALAGTPGYPTGREIYAQIFRQADSLAPNATLYLNDYVAIEQGDLPTNGITGWKSKLDELVAAGAPVEGIGFQGHFSSSPTGIPRVKEIYDDFWATYGLEAKVTEYDISQLVPPAVQARYMRDILTVSFAHPSMKGFLMWGFWDGAHWLGNAPVFNEDWSLKPSGEAFVDQVFRQWWTDTTAAVSPSGDVTLRGFRGKYRLRVMCGNSIQEQDVVLDGDKTLTVNLPCTVRTRDVADDFEIKVAALPLEDALLISWSEGVLKEQVRLSVFDAIGRGIADQTMQSTIGSCQLDTSSWPPGVYFITIQNGTQCHTIKFIR